VGSPVSGAPSAQEWIDQCETLVSRRGHRNAFRRRGQGPTVLMLHGFPTWSYDYAEVAADLAADHDVITLDFLGYGALDKPRQTPTNPDKPNPWPQYCAPAYPVQRRTRRPSRPVGKALADWEGPLHLVWGLDDPVSGRHVLEKATAVLPNAELTELLGVGHFPPSEAPHAVAAAVRKH